MLFAQPPEPPPDFNAMCGDIACRVERVPSRWQLVSVGRDLRTLRLVYESGGCRRGNGRARVIETPSRIRIAVDEDEVVAIDTPDRQVACTLELRYRTLRVELERRVAGRAIRGWGAAVSAPFTARVPRVIDLAPSDARKVLEARGFEVRRFGRRRGAVKFQSPLPGKPVRGGVAGITVGRAFSAGPLVACVKGPGMTARPVRPSVGEERAPDLELVLSSATAPGFVALYADPARAEENEPGIRRNVRGTDALVERLGRVTIVWSKPPDATLASRVRDCVAGARP